MMAGAVGGLAREPVLARWGVRDAPSAGSIPGADWPRRRASPRTAGSAPQRNRKHAGGLRVSNDGTASVMSDVVRRRSSQRCLTLVHPIADFCRFHVVLHANVSPPGWS